MNNKDKKSSISKIIKNFEIELLDPKVRKNKKRLNDLLSDDFLEYASTGEIFTKKDILLNLPKETKRTFNISNLKVKDISENIFLVTYKIKKFDIDKNIKTLSIRSSIWKKDNNQFKMVFHQGSLIK